MHLWKETLLQKKKEAECPHQKERRNVWRNILTLFRHWGPYMGPTGCEQFCVFNVSVEINLFIQNITWSPPCFPWYSSLTPKSSAQTDQKKIIPRNKNSNTEVHGVPKNKRHCIQYLPGPAWRDPLLALWKEPPGLHCRRARNRQPQYCGQAAGRPSRKAHPLWSVEKKKKPFTRGCTSELLKPQEETILRAVKLFKHPEALTSFTWMQLLHIAQLVRKTGICSPIFIYLAAVTFWVGASLTPTVHVLRKGLVPSQWNYLETWKLDNVVPKVH